MEYLKQPRPRPEEATREIRDTVSTVIADVAREGMAAVRRYSERYDGWSPPSFRVPLEVIDRAIEQMDPAWRRARGS